MARRATAGGPLPRVHPGRHRHRRQGRARLPPRHRGGAGDGRGDGRVGRPRAADAAAGQQPQADPGLLRRDRRGRHRGGDAGHRQARQGAPRRGGGDARRPGGAGPEAGAAVPGAGPDPCHRHRVRRPGSGAGGEQRPPGGGAHRAGCRPRRLRLGSASRLRRGGRPAHRPRPGLLHRHGVRDRARGLRVAGLDLLRRPVRRAGQRRQGHLPRRGHLAGGQPDAGAVVGA